AVAYSLYRYFTVRRRVKTLRLGLDGEKAVGQFLERLRAQDCKVFHDIPGDGFNLDHVVVAPQGIFVIETKTYSKPIRGAANVQYDGEKLLVNGKEIERNPVRQALAERNWLQDLLEHTTDRRFPIKAVIVFPGWFVETTPNRNTNNLWVLNPRALPT